MKINQIVLTKGAPEQANFAASELRYYLSLMTGKAFQIHETTCENSIIIEQNESASPISASYPPTTKLYAIHKIHDGSVIRRKSLSFFIP